MNILLILVPIIFFGAFIDAIAGGGGLITLTAYVAVGLPPQLALGTNKFAASFGTSIASVQYMRSGEISWRSAVFAIPASFIGSAIGSSMANRWANEYLGYLLLILVPAIALFMMINPSFGQGRARRPLTLMSVAALLGAVLGWYDGFFGPGTGMFLTLGFTVLLGLDLLRSSGTARVVNLSSNLAALTVFLISGSVDFSLGIPCAIASLAGGWVGSRLALRIGKRVIKPIMLLVLALLLIKVALQLF